MPQLPCPWEGKSEVCSVLSPRFPRGLDPHMPSAWASFSFVSCPIAPLVPLGFNSPKNYLHASLVAESAFGEVPSLAKQEKVQFCISCIPDKEKGLLFLSAVASSGL